jgi:peptidoglycan/LPS O-acetylase OafA/YrhL
MSTLGASLLVCAALTCAPFAQLLSCAISRFFGRISFGIYLTHMPLLAGILAPLYGLYGHTSPLAMGICIVAFFALLLPWAFLFTIAIDDPSQSLSAAIKSARRISLPAAEPPPMATNSPN